MKIIEYFRRGGRASDRTVQLLDATVQGIDNQSRLLNEKLEQLIEGMNNQSRDTNRRMDRQIETSELLLSSINRIIEALNNQARDANLRMDQLISIAQDGKSAHRGSSASHAAEEGALTSSDGEVVSEVLSKAKIDSSCLVAFAQLPFPHIELNTPDAIARIIESPEYDVVWKYFKNEPVLARSLLGSKSLALLFCMLRNQRPYNIAEIGTFAGGASFMLASALLANGRGSLHTVGPFDSERFPPFFKTWPQELKATTRFHPISSMDFYMLMDKETTKLDFVLVDGNHDYEFALFDIQCAAHRIVPGGFIVIDNVSQSGPYFAIVDFLEHAKTWIDCGEKRDLVNWRAYDHERSNIQGTDFMVLRAPTSYPVRERPQKVSEIHWANSQIGGVRLKVLNGVGFPGSVHVQCVLRAFSPESPISEDVAAASQEIGPGDEEVEVVFAQPLRTRSGLRNTVETWISWCGAEPLLLEAEPAPF
jgi:predicted O-methyltransferase YrrM